MLDTYRVHMTLSGALPAERRDPIATSLQEAYARVCGDRPIPVDTLALVRQAHAADRFRVTRHHLLRI